MSLPSGYIETAEQVVKLRIEFYCPRCERMFRREGTVPLESVSFCYLSLCRSCTREVESMLTERPSTVDRS